MAFNLVVTSAFDSFSRGDIITDQTLVTAILADERANNVVRVSASEPAA